MTLECSTSDVVPADKSSLTLPLPSRGAVWNESNRVVEMQSDERRNWGAAAKATGCLSAAGASRTVPILFFPTSYLGVTGKLQNSMGHRGNWVLRIFFKSS